MNQILLTTVDGLEPGDAVAIARRLTHSGSEFQAEVQQVLAGESSSCTPVAIWNHDGAVVGWACSHVWEGHQTLEQFTDERHRGKGVATALAAVLVAAGVIDRGREVAVFSDATAQIASKLGVAGVVKFERRGGGWARI